MKLVVEVRHVFPGFKLQGFTRLICRGVAKWLLADHE